MVTRAAAAEILDEVASRSAERKPLRPRRRSRLSADDIGVPSRIQLTPKQTWGVISCLGFVAPFALARLNRAAFLDAVPADPLLWWRDFSGLVFLASGVTLMLAIALLVLAVLKAKRWLSWLLSAPVIGCWALALLSDGTTGGAVYPDGVILRDARWRLVEERHYRWSDVERLETSCSGRDHQGRGPGPERRTYFHGLTYALHFKDGRSLALERAGHDWSHRDAARWLDGAAVMDAALRREGVRRTRTLLGDKVLLSPHCVRGLRDEFAGQERQWLRIRQMLDISDAEIRAAHALAG